MIEKLRDDRVVHLAITAPPVNVLDGAILRKLVEDLDDMFNGLSAPVLRITKQALAKSLTEGCAERLDTFKAVFMSELYRLEDVAEGIKSFEERRSPEWKHR